MHTLIDTAITILGGTAVWIFKRGQDQVHPGKPSKNGNGNGTLRDVMDRIDQRTAVMDARLLRVEGRLDRLENGPVRAQEPPGAPKGDGDGSSPVQEP